MPEKNGRHKLVREGEPSQETEKGLAIPVPDRKSVMDVFDKAIKKKGKPSRSAKGKRRTSRDGQ